MEDSTACVQQLAVDSKVDVPSAAKHQHTDPDPEVAQSPSSLASFPLELLVVLHESASARSPQRGSRLPFLEKCVLEFAHLLASHLLGPLGDGKLSSAPP